MPQKDNTVTPRYKALAKRTGKYVASGRKFNLRWVAKRARKFYRKYTQVA